MSAYSTIDRETFDWVKTEVDSALKDAGVELHAFDTSDNKEKLYEVSNHLHQIVGSLQMLELKSLSTLIMESELLVEDYIASDKSIEKSAFLVLLESAFSALIFSLQKSGPGSIESPIPLVELINQIRAVRGLDAIEISSLFSPVIDVFPEVDAQHSLRDDQYRKRASALRDRFQVFFAALVTR